MSWPDQLLGADVEQPAPADIDTTCRSPRSDVRHRPVTAARTTRDQPGIDGLVVGHRADGITDIHHPEQAAGFVHRSHLQPKGL
jgi:hypothetical protein